jgi:hypothetical protein
MARVKILGYKVKKQGLNVTAALLMELNASGSGFVVRNAVFWGVTPRWSS